jgi:hypothetical protein
METAMSSDLHDDDTETMEACDVPATPAREVPDIPFGVTRGMSNEDYHGDRSAVSSTQLKRMLISPAHFLSGITDPEESTEALLFGSVLHGRLLEPDTFESRFFAMPKVNRARKEGKQRYAECMVQAAGRTVYPEAWKEPIERIIDNAMTHRKARELLAKGEAEVALVWLDPDTGSQVQDQDRLVARRPHARRREVRRGRHLRRLPPFLRQARLRAVRGDVLRGRLPAHRRGT